MSTHVVEIPARDVMAGDFAKTAGAFHKVLRTVKVDAAQSFFKTPSVSLEFGADRVDTYGPMQRIEVIDNEDS